MSMFPPSHYACAEHNQKKDEVLRLAKECGADFSVIGFGITFGTEELLAFANAIEQKAMEAKSGEWTEVNSIFLPPSGRVVLAFDGRRAVRAKWIAKFSDDNVSDEGDFYDYRESDDTYWLPEGWYECINHWGEFNMVHINDVITHWMPLPATPAAIRANKE